MKLIKLLLYPIIAVGLLLGAIHLSSPWWVPRLVQTAAARWLLAECTVRQGSFNPFALRLLADDGQIVARREGVLVKAKLGAFSARIDAFPFIREKRLAEVFLDLPDIEVTVGGEATGRLSSPGVPRPQARIFHTSSAADAQSRLSADFSSVGLLNRVLITAQPSVGKVAIQAPLSALTTNKREICGLAGIVPAAVTQPTLPALPASAWRVDACRLKIGHVLLNIHRAGKVQTTSFDLALDRTYRDVARWEDLAAPLLQDLLEQPAVSGLLPSFFH